MLIIAQPKTASTSLVQTVGEYLDIEFSHGVGKKKCDKKCEGFTEIQKYHVFL